MTCGIGLDNAIASADNALGDVHGGAGQQALELYLDSEWDMAAGASLEQAGEGG